MNFGSFGEIVFRTVFSPKRLKEAKSYSYKVHKPVNTEVLYEYLGKDEESLEISIVLNEDAKFRIWRRRI